MAKNPFSTNSANVDAQSAFEVSGKPIDQDGWEVMNNRRAEVAAAVQEALKRPSPVSPTFGHTEQAVLRQNPLQQPSVMPSFEQAPVTYPIPSRQEAIGQAPQPSVVTSLPPRNFISANAPAEQQNPSANIDDEQAQRLAEARRNVGDSYGQAA